MDVDISSTTSKYYQILKNRRADLDFLMPQFYNGVTRPATDGVNGSGAGSMSALSIFNNLSNDMFPSEPHKVVFGFCISDCSGTGSNVSANQAVKVMSDLKAFYPCNGGSFFWVAEHDLGGTWSDTVWNQISTTVGCSSSSTAAPVTASPTSLAPTSSKPSSAAPTNLPTAKPTTLLVSFLTGK
jgi:hypothetical protein